MLILTRCPSVLSWSGKHMLHTSQWKKLFRPPIRQMPHPSQWYWSLSSSSNKLQIKHVNCKKEDGKNETNELHFRPFEEFEGMEYLPFQSEHHISRIQLVLFVAYHNSCKLIPLTFSYRNDDPRFHRDSIDNCRIFHSTVSKGSQTTSTSDESIKWQKWKETHVKKSKSN